MNFRSSRASYPLPVLRPETALSRRYLKVLEKWLPVGKRSFTEWPVRPDCGHFLGGCHWYGIETLAGALACAAAASSPEYDPVIGGCSRGELRTMAREALRYLCFTHDSGPADCVRPESGLGRPENCGTKWGERGKGFFPESQCGTTVSGMALVALLLGNAIDDETWELIAAVHADYAARFGAMEPRKGVYFDTQMEENGWTSCGLASVSCLLAQAPEAPKWAAAARRWMFSSAAAPQDAKNHGAYADGRTVAEWTGQTFTTLPDYMAENHGMVHPNYTGASVHFLGYLGVIYAAYGLPLPKHASFNRDRIYDQLKLTTDRTGSLHPVQGMDWPYLATDPCTITHAAAAVLLRDPDAARLERWALSTMEARQASQGGRMINPEVAAVCKDMQDPMAIRECLITGPAYTYLFHRLLGDGPSPTPDLKLEHKLRRVKVYPHSGFVFQRHPRGQTSFAWRNFQMALPLNVDGIQTVAPATRSWLADVTVRNRPDSQEEVSVHVDTTVPNGFAAALVMNRAQGSVQQQVLYAGLPDGTSLSFERWIARENVEVTQVTQGFLRIINENYSALPDNCHGYREVTTPAGTSRFDGFVSANPDSDLIHTYDHPAWINIDRRLGIVFRSSDETVYHNRHFFPTWWATADDLILSRAHTRRKVKAGAVVTQLAAIITPGQSVKQTATTRLIELAAPSGCTALIGGGHLAAANFERDTPRITLLAKRSVFTLVPIYAGHTRLTDTTVSFSLALSRGHAALFEPLAFLTITGEVEVTAASGSIVVHNPGSTTAVITKGTRTVKLKPGRMQAVSGSTP